jgi:uncharacterized protein
MLLKQFRSFYARNYPRDMEQQIKYFSVFGGLGWPVDTDIAISELIQEMILENYGHLHNELAALSLDDPQYIRLLHALAVGDRRIFGAFNRAGLNNSNGGTALNYLQNNHILEVEVQRPLLNDTILSKKRIKKQRLSHKMRFTKPFLRFWFYFITPFAREIERGVYRNVLERFERYQNSYTSFIFEELSQIMLNYYTRDDGILTLGSYWDANTEIDILAVTKRANIYVGECKWTNHKINKKELHKLIDKCNRLHLQPSKILLFSKRGFSKELQEQQGSELLLYSADDFSALLKGVDASSLLPGFARPNTAL